MPAIQTISSSSKEVFQILQENGHISLSFICDTKIKRGAAVKLLSTGKVAVIAAVTDKVLGIVTVGNKEAGGKVTVHIKAAARLICQADGGVTCGGLLDVSGYDTATDLTKVKAHVAFAASVSYAQADFATLNANNYAIALETVLTGATVEVAIL